MIRTLQTIILIIFLGACHNSSNPTKDSKADTVKFVDRNDLKLSCEDGIKWAIEDSKKGILGHIAYGDRLTGKIYDSILENEYNIRVYPEGCMFAIGWRCYNHFMDSLINLKFRTNVLKTAFLKSEKIEYIKLTGKDPSKFSVINFNDSEQESYLREFLQADSIYATKTAKIIEKNLNPIVSKYGLVFSIEHPLIVLFDTNGYATEIQNKKISVSIKKQILTELNKYGKLGIFEIEGQKKNFITPYLTHN